MLTLVEFKTEHTDQLISWIENEKSLMKWGGPFFQYPLTKEQLITYKDEANRRAFQVYDTSTKNIVGHLSIGRIDYETKQARIGKVIVHPLSRGTGIGQKMMMLIIQYAFEELNLQKVTLGVFEFNTPALHCYEKVGFQKDRFLKNHRKIGKEQWSLYEMSLTRDAWEKNKQKSL